MVFLLIFFSWLLLHLLPIVCRFNGIGLLSAPAGALIQFKPHELPHESKNCIHIQNLKKKKLNDCSIMFFDNVNENSQRWWSNYKHNGHAFNMDGMGFVQKRFYVICTQRYRHAVWSSWNHKIGVGVHYMETQDQPVKHVDFKLFPAKIESIHSSCAGSTPQKGFLNCPTMKCRRLVSKLRIHLWLMNS